MCDRLDAESAKFLDGWRAVVGGRPWDEEKLRDAREYLSRPWTLAPCGDCPTCLRRASEMEALESSEREEAKRAWEEEHRVVSDAVDEMQRRLRDENLRRVFGGAEPAPKKSVVPDLPLPKMEPFKMWKTRQQGLSVFYPPWVTVTTTENPVNTGSTITYTEDPNCNGVIYFFSGEGGSQS